MANHDNPIMDDKIDASTLSMATTDAILDKIKDISTVVSPQSSQDSLQQQQNTTVNPAHPQSVRQPSMLTRRRYFSKWLNTPIREDLLLECELLLLAFATGMQDAVSYPDYLCFASNQTGNTVFLAIGASGIVPSSVFRFSEIGPSIGVALSLFITGGWVMGQIGNVVGPRRRLWLLLSSLVQTVMVFAAVAIQYTRPIRVTGWEALVVLALLAFSSGGQVAMARGLKITEITTAMATAAYVDLMVDPNLWAKDNRSRNRRAAFLVMLAGGSFAGAYGHRAVNSPFALLISAIIKIVVTVMLGFNKEMEQGSDEKKDILMLG
jgi:uncharacterized membrane protein YoaK (UPF0700 family)